MRIVENVPQSVFGGVSARYPPLHRGNRQGWDSSSTGITENIRELTSERGLLRAFNSPFLPNTAIFSRFHLPAGISHLGTGISPPYWFYLGLRTASDENNGEYLRITVLKPMIYAPWRAIIGIKPHFLLFSG